MGSGVFPVTVAGKTGTGQTPRGANYHHAWFTGYAPVEDPQVVVAVLIEYGGSATQVAIPVARDFLAGFYADAAGVRAAQR